MDEMKIGSKYMQGILTKVIHKVVKKKLGVDAELQFNDPITVTFDGEKAHLHLNADATLDKTDLDKLLKDLI